MELKDYLYYQDDAGEIYCGDCLEIMPLLKDKSIDLCLTDPPYGVDIDNWDVAPNETFITECKRVSNGAVIMFGGASMRSITEFVKLNPDRLLVWTPAFTLSHLQSNGMSWRFHTIWCWNLPQKQDGVVWDVLSDNTECGNWWKHSCTKPVSLMEKLVCIVKETDLILDPFLGSGTTAVACKRLNRRFIGIEISEKYCEIAKNRLQNVVEPLFKGVVK